MKNDFLFDWVDPDCFNNDLAVEALERYMIDSLFLDPETETPSFERDKNAILCNNFEFQLPSELREIL